MTPASNSPPTEGHAMEVDEEGVVSPPASPVSQEDDNLLTGGDAVGVEAGLAHLPVSSPSRPDGEGEEASISEVLPRCLNNNWEVLLQIASMLPPSCLQGKDGTDGTCEEEPDEPEDGEPNLVKTPE